MNDYNELAEMLRSMSRAIIREDANALDIPEENIWDADANAINDAADAIEQLVKERDAAVADLRFVIASACDLDVCLWCKHREFDGQCHHDCIPYSEKWGWEWRGVKEDNDGKID